MGEGDRRRSQEGVSAQRAHRAPTHQPLNKCRVHRKLEITISELDTNTSRQVIKVNVVGLRIRSLPQQLGGGGGG